MTKSTVNCVGEVVTEQQPGQTAVITTTREYDQYGQQSTETQTGLNPKVSATTYSTDGKQEQETQDTGIPADGVRTHETRSYYSLENSRFVDERAGKGDHHGQSVRDHQLGGDCRAARVDPVQQNSFRANADGYRLRWLRANYAGQGSRWRQADDHQLRLR